MISDSASEHDAQGTGLWNHPGAGGCAAKLPAALVEALDLEAAGADPSQSYMSDVAVVGVGASQIVHTLDFITPIVLDPAAFGRIAAANALSDVFVAGAIPISSLAICCVPEEQFQLMTVAIRAARELLEAHGCPLGGGHSIRDDQPKLGFSVVGRPNRTGRLLHEGALPGDALLLTKPLGVGIIASAAMAGDATPSTLEPAIELMTNTNRFVPDLVESSIGPSLHAATDVTGFGLLGHLKELCRRSGVGAILSVPDIPAIDGARALASRGTCTSAAGTNEQYAQTDCMFPITDLEDTDRLLLTDPQTSGGALLVVDPSAIDGVVNFLSDYQVKASRIGDITSSPGLRIA